ncbi:MAG: acyloxyacyl hydrolase [Planctomycetota bacterium]
MAILFALSAPPVAAAARARLRLDFSMLHGVDSGRTDRTEDAAVVGSVERERRVLSRGAVAGVVIPLFAYEDCEPERRFGAGAGVAARAYARADVRRGPFGEVGLAAIWVARRLIGDDSFLDFQSHVAAGYAASNGSHFAIRFQHLSNGSLRPHNSGANLLGVAVGFTF